MKMRTIVGIVLLAAGVLGMVYGGFTYVEERHDVSVGPIDLAVEDKERVEIPMWLSALVAVAGLVVIVAPRK